MLHKAWNSKGEMPYCFPRSFIKFQGHTVQNITDFYPNWVFPDYRPVAAFKSLRLALFNLKPVLFYQTLLLLFIWSRRGLWNSLILYLGVTIGAQWAIDSAIGTGFYKLLSVFAKLYPSHMPQFYIPTIGNHRNNSKIAPISHYLVPTSTGKALALVDSYAIFSAVDTRLRDTGYPVCCTS